MAAAKNKGLIAEDRLVKRLAVLPPDWTPVKVAASGSVTHKKGDLKSARNLIENKQTDRDSFSMTRAVLNKIQREATEQGGRVPLLTVQMGAAESDEVRVVVMREQDFMELVTELESWKADYNKLDWQSGP